MSQPMLEAALAWLERGVSLLPLQPRSKFLVRGFGPHLRQITRPDEARLWFGERTCNLGLVCGGNSGLVVLDFDRPADYRQWCASAGDLAQLYTERTARGWHVFFFAGEVPSRQAGAIEIKGDGSVVMVSPSVHPSGRVYRPLDAGAPLVRVGADRLLLLSPWMACTDHELGQERHAGRVARQAATTGRDDLVSRLKTAWPTLALARSLTRLKTRDGQWWHGRCPLPGHEDRTPSFWVDAERGVWGCYACHTRGDAINLYALQHGLTVPEAIREMAHRLRET